MNQCLNCGNFFYGPGSYCEDCLDELAENDPILGEFQGFIQFPPVDNISFNYQCPNCRGLYNSPAKGQDVRLDLCFVCPFCGLPMKGLEIRKWPAKDPYETPKNEEISGEFEDFED